MNWAQRTNQLLAAEHDVIGDHIGVILIVTGALTAVAIFQFVAPAPILRIIYGEGPKDPPGLALARHWALLIFLIGALLVYAAFHAAIRDPIVLVAAIEKIGLGVEVLGTALRRHPVAAAIAAGDSVIALIYLLYLAGY